MNTMRTVSRSLVGLIAICWAGLAAAQNTPIPGIGYNENIVVGVGESFANAPITATMDNGTTPYGGNTWYAMGQNTTALATGLPMGTQFTVADATTGGDTFQFQGTDMNNAIFLAGNGSGPTTATYTLALAGTCSSLSFLAASGNGNGTIGVTLNYSDGSTVNESITTGDWFGNTPVAYNASGRINPGGYDSVNTTNPNLYYYDLTALPTSANLQGITFTFTSGANANTHTAIMGVSGNLIASAPITWTGGSTAMWSLATSDTNWNSPSQAYTDGANVIFDNTGTNTNITIASAVQPSTVVFNNSTNPYSFSGAGIAGGGSVLLSSSAGSVTFSNNNTYTGPTTINGGTLTIAANGSLAPASNVSVGPAGTLVAAGLVGGNATLTGGVISLSGGTLGGTLGMSGGTLAGSGLVAGNTTLAGNGVINLSGGTVGGTLTVNGGVWSGTGTVAGQITSSIPLYPSGNGLFSIASGGVLNSTSPNGVTIASGSMVVGGSLVASGSLAVNGGTLQVAPAAAAARFRPAHRSQTTGRLSSTVAIR